MFGDSITPRGKPSSSISRDSVGQFLAMLIYLRNLMHIFKNEGRPTQS